MSERATTPRRAAFGLPGRIQAPNSRPRSIALVGLGEGGASIARALAGQGLPGVDVHVLAKSAQGDVSAVAAVQAAGGDLQRALQGADMIFLVARHGDDVGLAPVVSSIAHGRNHSVTALYIVSAEKVGAEDETLRTLRSAAEMLVVVSDESYVAAMVHALGGQEDA